MPDPSIRHVQADALPTSAAGRRPPALEPMPCSAWSENVRWPRQIGPPPGPSSASQVVSMPRDSLPSPTFATPKMTPPALAISRTRRMWAWALAALLLTGRAVGAQQAAMETVFLPSLSIPMVRAGVEMDGRVDEADWMEAPVLSGVMHLPDFGGEPTERTEFRIVHDGKYLYFSCKAFDSDPAGIRAPSLLRDERRFLNDTCSFYLDTSNDEENAIGFVTTPTGLRPRTGRGGMQRSASPSRASSSRTMPAAS